MIQAIYANTWDALTLKMLGYYHDHCHHFYSGLTSDLPSEYKRFKNTSKYVFIYEEDEPPKFKFQKNYFLGTPHTNKETKIDTLDYEENTDVQ